MDITVRKAQPGDREKVLAVEAKAMPGLRYAGAVWDLFLADRSGSWSVAELDGAIVGCGKYTVLPDGSAWLETLRVSPECQRLGVGKRFYEHWLALAREQGVSILRMYTGADNRASKGLAERYGLRVAAHFLEGRLPGPHVAHASTVEFQLIRDPAEAVALLMPRQANWGPFLVMNRTYFAFTPALCAHLAASGMLYADPGRANIVTLGARFMPQEALHIGVMDGDLAACLEWALMQASQRNVGRLNIQYPPHRQDVRQALHDRGFGLPATDFIVMEVRLEAPPGGPRQAADGRLVRQDAQDTACVDVL